MSVMRIKDAQGNWQEVAALHGLPGTSVSITSISQSTEDDGYSVVTFSDGKTLRVKNGSKGSAGEGGAGGILWVDCTPSEDGTSFTADKTFEDVGMAVAQNKQVIARVFGGIFVPLVMIEEGIALFSAVFAIGDDKVTMTLTMADDGTNIASYAPAGGMVVANITTEDGETFTADKTLTELNDAVANGQAVYMSFEGIVAPVQCINDTYAVFAITIPDMGDGGGKVTFVMMYDGTVTMSMAPDSGNGGALRVVVERTNSGECTSTMTASEIFAAVEAGQQVECLAFVGNTANVFLRPAIITPEMVLFGGVYGSSVLGLKNQYCSVIVTNNTHTYSFSPLDKLPNPQPLTINGTSYDGSEAVNIDIAGGGGDNKFTNIFINNDISNVTKATLRTDNNGQYLALSAAVVEMNVPASDEASWVTFTFLNDRERTLSVTINQGVNTTASYFRACCFVYHGKAIVWCTSPVAGYSEQPISTIHPPYIQNFIDINKITGVEISAGKKFPASTRCSFLGVKI